MDKSELTRLKELAEKATPYTEYDIPLIKDVEMHWAVEAKTRTDLEFHAVANPQTVLALIAEIERLDQEADWLAGEVNAWEHDQYDGTGNHIRSISELREAARKAVEE